MVIDENLVTYHWHKKLGSTGINPPESFDHYDLETVCGERSRDIIDRTAHLLEICDPHPTVVQPIVEAAIVAIEIVWRG